MRSSRLASIGKIAGIALVGVALATELAKPADERDCFTEHVFGVGWSVNLARLVELVRR